MLKTTIQFDEGCKTIADRREKMISQFLDLLDEMTLKDTKFGVEAVSIELKLLQPGDVGDSLSTDINLIQPDEDEKEPAVKVRKQALSFVTAIQARLKSEGKQGRVPILSLNQDGFMTLRWGIYRQITVHCTFGLYEDDAYKPKDFLLFSVMDYTNSQVEHKYPDSIDELVECVMQTSLMAN